MKISDILFYLSLICYGIAIYLDFSWFLGGAALGLYISAIIAIWYEHKTEFERKERERKRGPTF